MSRFHRFASAAFGAGVMLIGCRDDARIASGMSGYLEQCTSTSECSNGLSCVFEVCTHTCGIACSDGAECVESVNACLPPDIADRLRTDGSVGLDGSVGFDGSVGLDGSIGFDGSVGLDGSIGFDGSVGLDGSVGFDGSVIGGDGGIAPEGLTRCEGPDDLESSAELLLSIDDLGGAYVIAASRMIFEDDGTPNLVFSVGNDPRIAPSAFELGYHARRVAEGWSVRSIHPPELDNAEVVAVADAPGAGIYAIFRENDCYGGLTCRTALMHADADGSLTVTEDLFALAALGDFSDAPDPRIVDFTRLPSGGYRVLAVVASTVVAPVPDDFTIGALHRVDLDAGGHVISRRTFELRTSGGEPCHIENVSNLVFGDDDALSFLAYDRGHFVRFEGSIAEGGALIGTVLDLVGEPARPFVLFDQTVVGGDFTVFYAVCGGVSCDIRTERVDAATGAGSTPGTLASYSTAEDDHTVSFGAGFDDMPRFGDPNAILLEPLFSFGVPTAPSRTFSSPEEGFAELAWTVDDVDSGAGEAGTLQRASSLMLHRGRVYGALQLTNARVGSTENTRVYFRRCR